MAIELEVEEYCRNCEAFDPKAYQIKMETCGLSYKEDLRTIVRCSEHKKCAHMYQHALREAEKKVGY